MAALGRLTTAVSCMAFARGLSSKGAKEFRPIGFGIDAPTEHRATFWNSGS